MGRDFLVEREAEIHRRVLKGILGLEGEDWTKVKNKESK